MFALSSVAHADVDVKAVVPGTCGNNDKEIGEQCDGSDLGGATCQSLGYDRGTLSCSGSCSYDVSQCEQTSSVGAGGDKQLTREEQRELTRATVSGRGYPGTKIVLLVDGERQETSLTNSEGEFSITTSQVSPGLHSLSVVTVSDDIKGGRTESVTVRFQEDLVTQVSGLVFSPAFYSVSRYRSPLRLRFSGVAVPNQRIRVTTLAH
jgi:hypothetical protein